MFFPNVNGSDENEEACASVVMINNDKCVPERD